MSYIRLERGFAYLVAIIDWYSHKVLSWRISNSLDAAFRVDCLEDALREYGKAEIFNSDQVPQFPSHAFTGVLKREGVSISMDGCGRALENLFVERLWRNVKYYASGLGGGAMIVDKFGTRGKSPEPLSCTGAPAAAAAGQRCSAACEEVDAA